MNDTPTTASDAAPLTDPGPAPALPAGRPGAWDRFFAWVSGLGMVRADGWLGGVCSGIASRLGVDPIIVRGVFVVAALFGLPMFLVYAIGWALLPDLSGRIHLRELTRGRFDPAMVGIGIMIVIGIFPVVPWFFAITLPFGVFDAFRWFELTPWGVLSTFVLVAVIGGVIYLVVRSSNRAPASGATSATDPRQASADPTSSGEPAPDDSGLRAPADPAPGDAPASSGAAGSALAPPPAEPTPAPSATDAEMAAWRAQHDAWRVQDAAWRRQQQDAERAARDHARAERAAAASAFALEAAERRRVRQAANPRTSFGFVVFVIGAALVAGAIASLWRGSIEPDQPVVAVATGLFAAALVAALAMIVAGAVRRRSGFLAFLTVALLVAGTITAAVPILRGIAFGSVYIDSYNARTVTQLWGELNISAIHAEDFEPKPIVVEKRRGDTYITVETDVVLTLNAVVPSPISWTKVDWSRGDQVAEGTWSGTPTADGRVRIQTTADNSEPDPASESEADAESDGDVTEQVIELDQYAGDVYVTFTQP